MNNINIIDLSNHTDIESVYDIMQAFSTNTNYHFSNKDNYINDIEMLKNLYHAKEFTVYILGLHYYIFW